MAVCFTNSSGDYSYNNSSPDTGVDYGSSGGDNSSSSTTCVTAEDFDGKTNYKDEYPFRWIQPSSNSKIKDDYTEKGIYGYKHIQLNWKTYLDNVKTKGNEISAIRTNRGNKRSTSGDITNPVKFDRGLQVILDYGGVTKKNQITFPNVWLGIACALEYASTKGSGNLCKLNSIYHQHYKYDCSDYNDGYGCAAKRLYWVSRMCLVLECKPSYFINVKKENIIKNLVAAWCMVESGYCVHEDDLKISYRIMEWRKKAGVQVTGNSDGTLNVSAMHRNYKREAKKNLKNINALLGVIDEDMKQLNK